MQVNRHTIALFQYIAFAPEHIAKKYCNGYKRFFKVEYIKRVKTETPDGRAVRYVPVVEEKVNHDWFLPENNRGDSSFNGLLFRDNRVYVLNISLFDEYDNYKERYLDITEEFNALLKTYNIYHLCLIIPAALRRYYREYILTENLLPYIQTDADYLLPKFRYKLQSNHSRHRKFLEGLRGDSNKRWHNIFNHAINKIGNLSAFAALRTERPQFFAGNFYTKIPQLHNSRHKAKSPDGVQKGARKSRTLLFGKDFENR